MFENKSFYYFKRLLSFLLPTTAFHVVIGDTAHHQPTADTTLESSFLRTNLPQESNQKSAVINFPLIFIHYLLFLSPQFLTLIEYRHYEL